MNKHHTLSPTLNAQMQGFLSAYRLLDQTRTTPRHEREYAMIEYLLSCFLASREERLVDSMSPEVRDALSIAGALFPFGIPKLSICVDVRVNPILITGQRSSAFQTAAGDNDVEFRRANDGGLFLKQGKFTAMLDRAFQHTDTLVEVLDSHRGCAARAKKSKHARGVMPADAGLYEDVARKKEMCTAINDYVRRTYGTTKNVHCIQTSFDPHSGFLIMGLERGLAQDGTREFTKEMLDQFIRDGAVLSTRHLIEHNDGALRQVFARYFFSIDYPERYRESVVQFWQNMKSIIEREPVLFQRVYDMVAALFTRETPLLMRQRAVMLFANAYSGYLHNAQRYPFGNHDESTIVISYTNQGPYACARPFQIDPQTPHLSSVIYFVEEIIRDNRANNRVLPEEQRMRDEHYRQVNNVAAEYARCPILVHLFERVPTLPTDEERAWLASVDWTGLPFDAWMDADTIEKRYPAIPKNLLSAISALCARACDLTAHGDASDSFIEGTLILVCTLTGPNRETLALIPFMVKGF